MSELDIAQGSYGAEALAPEAAPMGGAMLRAARESAGLHIGALAVMLKVPVKKLEALEADRVDLLPDAVFVRALAASVCRTLKIDPAPVLARLPVTATPRLKSVESGINAPFRVPGVDPGSPIRDRLTSPLGMAVLTMLIGALVLFFAPPWDRIEQMLGVGQRSAGGAADMAPQPAQALASADGKQSEFNSVAEVKSSAVPGTVSSPVSVSAPLPTSVASAGSAPPVLAASPASAAPTPVADLAGNVVIRARATSWVEVTDAAGVVQLRKIMNAGEGVGVSGKRPLSVVLGRADVVDVTVSGKPYPLVNVSRDKVARFEVK